MSISEGKMDGGVEGKGGFIFVGDLLPLHGEQKEASKQASSRKYLQLLIHRYYKKISLQPAAEKAVKQILEPREFIRRGRRRARRPFRGGIVGIRSDALAISDGKIRLVDINAGDFAGVGTALGTLLVEAAAVVAAAGLANVAAAADGGGAAADGDSYRRC